MRICECTFANIWPGPVHRGSHGALCMDVWRACRRSLSTAKCMPGCKVQYSCDGERRGYSHCSYSNCNCCACVGTVPGGHPAAGSRISRLCVSTVWRHVCTRDGPGLQHRRRPGESGDRRQLDGHRDGDSHRQKHSWALWTHFPAFRIGCHSRSPRALFRACGQTRGSDFCTSSRNPDWQRRRSRTC